MKFFHVYNEDCYKGLEKNGLLNKDTGFKIQHAFSVPERLKFNEFAKTGSTLYNSQFSYLSYSVQSKYSGSSSSSISG